MHCAWHNSADQNFFHPTGQNFIIFGTNDQNYLKEQNFEAKFDRSKILKTTRRQASSSHLHEMKGGTKEPPTIQAGRHQILFQNKWNNLKQHMDHNPRREGEDTTTKKNRGRRFNQLQWKIEERMNSDSEKSINYSELTQKWHWIQKLYWKVIVTWMDIDWRILWTTRIYGTIVSRTTQIVGTGQAMSKLFHHFIFMLNYFLESYHSICYNLHLLFIITHVGTKSLKTTKTLQNFENQKLLVNSVDTIEEIFFLNWICMLCFLQMWEHRASDPSKGRYLKKDIERDIEDGYLLRYTLYWRNKWKFHLKKMLCYIVHRLTWVV